MFVYHPESPRFPYSHSKLVAPRTLEEERSDTSFPILEVLDQTDPGKPS